MKVKSESEVAQLYLTLSDPMDCSLAGSSSLPGWFSPRTPFRGVEGQQLQWPWFNLCRRRRQVSVFSWQSPFLLINLTMILRGAFHDHFIPWCWECPFSGLAKILLTGHLMCCYGLGHRTVSKILWTTCLTSLLVQENIPSCCFFPYLELHCYHHRSHMELYSILSGALVHIWQCKKQQFC